MSGVDAISDVLTELGAAQRFALEHGGIVRYDFRRARYLKWDAHRWAPDLDGEVHRLATRFVRDWQADALEIPDRDLRERTIKFLLRLESRQKLDNILALARAEHPIADAGESWDQDPWLLGTPAGVIDLQTGLLRAGQPRDRVTMWTAVPFDPQAECPRWTEFIQEISAGHEGLPEFLQRAAGYSSTGDTREQAFFMCNGGGGNGKSKLLDTLSYTLGDYSYAAPFATFAVHPSSSAEYNLAAIETKRLVTASEAQAKTRLHEERLKSLTGGEKTNGRHPYGRPFEFRPVCKIWLSANHRPAVLDDSFGFWRRVFLIPFDRSFVGADDDKQLGAKLKAEGPGVLRWVVEGCLQWQREGLNPPPCVIDATGAYQAENDQLADFLESCCEPEPDAETGSAALFQAYVNHCIREAIPERERLSHKAFSRRLTAKGYDRRRTARGIVFSGLAVADVGLKDRELFS